MQFIKLVIPGHLYDDLKLHPNQTIMLSNSEIACKPDSHSINVNTSINSKEVSKQDHETQLPETEVNEHWTENESFHENPDSSILTLTVNIGKGTQKILTYHLISIRVVSNIQSEFDTDEGTSTSCDDVGTSIRELNSLISEPLTKENNNNVVCNTPEETLIEPGAFCNYDNISIKSKENQLEKLLSDHEFDQGKDERRLEEPSFEYPWKSSTLLKNESGKRKILTCNRKSTSRVQNVHEGTFTTSDYLNATTKENHFIICEPDVYDNNTSICIKSEETSKGNNIHYNNGSILIHSMETSSQQQEFIMSDYDCIEKNNIRESGESGPENSDESFITDEKAKNGKQKIQTCITKSISCVSGVQNRPIITVPDNNYYPRLCTICNCLYESKTTFSNHKKSCGTKKKIKYPRCCMDCNRSYRSSKSFSRHKKTCGYQSNKKIVYPRCCAQCNRFYSNKASFSGHKSKCGLPPKGTKKQLSIYPRVCPYCYHTYSSKHSFWKHKQRCFKFSSASRNRKEPGELIPVKSFSEKALRYFVVKKDSTIQEKL